MLPYAPVHVVPDGIELVVVTRHLDGASYDLQLPDSAIELPRGRRDSVD